MKSKLFFVGIFFILFSQIAFAESVTVERDMPAKVKVGNIFEVMITATVSDSNPPSGYVVTEYYPAGFEVVNGGDAVNPTERKITWLVYGKPATDIQVKYAIKANEVKTASFSGNVLDNAEYKVSDTTGDKKIEVTSNEVDCISLWSCTAWNSCENGVQDRTCTDLNNCATPANKPPTSISCSSGSAGDSEGSGGGGSSGASAPNKVCDSNLTSIIPQTTDEPDLNEENQQTTPTNENIEKQTTAIDNKFVMPLKSLFTLLTKWINALFSLLK